MSEEEEDNSNTTNTRRAIPFTSMVTPRLILFTMLFYAGLFLVIGGLLDISFRPMIEKYGLTVLGLGISFYSLLFLTEDLRKRRVLRNEKFVDVDVRSREKTESILLDSLITEMRELKKESVEKPDFKRLEALLEKSTAAAASEEKVAETFTAYFGSIRRVLEQKANVADEKASILLDKGTSYSRWGIWFFIFSIVSWQLLSWIHEFQIQFIYGIASCSVLFIFIEFLSAWFLRQYRHFVDTSTYLIKVKSIFDRYMLCYLATQEFTDSINNKDRDKSLHELLSSDIKWPDTYLFKSADISFAKEALETMSLFVKTMKSEVKDKSKKDKNDG